MIFYALWGRRQIYKNIILSGSGGYTPPPSHLDSTTKKKLCVSSLNLLCSPLFWSIRPSVLQSVISSFHQKLRSFSKPPLGSELLFLNDVTFSFGFHYQSHFFSIGKKSLRPFIQIITF